MAIPKIQANYENKRSVAFSSTIGALAGAGARYILPTKNELSSILNKDAIDKFVSSASTNARGASRSIVKYGAIGAFIAGGVTLLKNLFPKPKTDSLEYAKLGALFDTPDSVCEFYIFSDKQ